MCLEDLQIARRKYTRFAPNPATPFPTKNPGTVTTAISPLPDNGELTLLIGANPLRTALRVVAPPDAVFGSEGGGWNFFDKLVLGFPVPAGTTDIHALTTPIYYMFALSTQTKLFDTITLDMVGTQLYEAWGFISLSFDLDANPLGMTVWDIMLDRETVYQAQNRGQLAG